MCAILYLSNETKSHLFQVTVTEAPEEVTLEDDFPMVTGSSGDKDEEGYGAIERFLRTEDPAVTDRTKAGIYNYLFYPPSSLGVYETLVYSI